MAVCVNRSHLLTRSLTAAFMLSLLSFFSAHALSPASTTFFVFSPRLSLPLLLMHSTG
jgi:hypothetical protein